MVIEPKKEGVIDKTQDKGPASVANRVFSCELWAGVPQGAHGRWAGFFSSVFSKTLQNGKTPFLISHGQKF